MRADQLNQSKKWGIEEREREKKDPPSSTFEDAILI